MSSSATTGTDKRPPPACARTGLTCRLAFADGCWKAARPGRSVGGLTTVADVPRDVLRVVLLGRTKPILRFARRRHGRHFTAQIDELLLSLRRRGTRQMRSLQEFKPHGGRGGRRGFGRFTGYQRAESTPDESRRTDRSKLRWNSWLGRNRSPAACHHRKSQKRVRGVRSAASYCQNCPGGSRGADDNRLHRRGLPEAVQRRCSTARTACVEKVTPEGHCSQSSPGRLPDATALDVHLSKQNELVAFIISVFTSGRLSPDFRRL